MPWNARLLKDREVQVWFRNLDSAGAEASRVLPYLSPDEKQRAERFHFDQHRNEFILSRGTLRLVLASYLDSSPESLSFEYSKHGKPSLTEAYAAQKLSFNLSHTAGMMLLAVVRERRIGVDVERIRSDFNVLEIAERFFSPQEQSRLRNFPKQAQHEAFFRCWTRKEAYIKAKGEGLSIPLRAFEVSLDPDTATLVATRPDETEARKWKMLNVPMSSHYAAATVVEADRSSDFEIRLQEVQDL
jgi:4'-phosphopantetheinyl transferase